MMTTVSQDLMFNSYQIRREVEDVGGIMTSTEYVPTDWSGSSKSEQEEFYGGFVPEVNGVCGECFQIKSKNGMCGC